MATNTGNSTSTDSDSPTSTSSAPSATSGSSVTPSSNPSSVTSSSTTSPTSLSDTSTTSSTSSTTSTSSSSSSSTSSVLTTTVSSGGKTVIVTTTSTQAPASITPTSTSPSSASTTAGLQPVGKSSSGGLGQAGTIAVAVVVPIVAVALLVLIGLFLWRKRKARKDAEEERRKEVEEYGYNPNNDPTLPAVGAGSDGAYEMREEGSSGYRGWGTTAAGSSTGRKASTTLSGPSAAGIGVAYSEGTSPTRGPVSETRSDNPFTDGRQVSGENEMLGAMGPSTTGNRNGDINRGPSNASSSYSAANISDASGEAAPSGAAYYNHYDTGNPYSETQYGSPPAGRGEGGQPVIRDVQARRNTRIENPSHFPQQSAGISQNF